METKFDMTVGGERVVANQYTAIRNPASGDVVGHAAIGDMTHLDRAVAAAEDAFNTWRWSSDLARREACRAIAKVCLDNAAELAALLTLEQGKPLKGFGSEFELRGMCSLGEWHRRSQPSRQSTSGQSGGPHRDAPRAN